MKILIIKPSSFGDIVQAVPCANALKQAYPGCAISWVSFKQWAPLLSIFPDIDYTQSWDRHKGVPEFFRVVKTLREQEFDIVIDLQGLSRSALLAKLIKGKKKIGVPGMKEFGNIFIKEAYPENAKMNATLRNLEPVRYLTGKTFQPGVKFAIDEKSLGEVKDILKSESVSGQYITLLPFARGKGKDWSIENYGRLIELLQKEYPQYKIVIAGSSDGRGKIKSGKSSDLCGKTNLKQLAALLAESSLCIGADTGPMHLSSVLNTPSVFIFGVSDINETAPCIGRFSLLINKENPKEINKIAPETVLKEAAKWIK